MKVPRDGRGLVRPLVTLCFVAAATVGRCQSNSSPAADPASRGAERAGWAARLPAGWLAAIAIHDLAAFDTRVGRLMPEPFAALGVERIVRAAAPGARLASRPIVVGLAAAGEADEITPFGLVPTDDFAALIDAMGADPTDSGAIGELGSYEIVLADLEGWAGISPRLPSPLGWSGSDASLNKPPEGAMTALVSSAGLRRLASSAGASPRRPIRWPVRPPSTLRDAATWVRVYEPVWRRLALASSGIQATIAADEEGLLATIGVDRRLAERRSEEVTEGAALALPAGKAPGAITELAGDRSPPRELVSLWLGIEESRPDQIESVAYAPAEFARYAAAVEAAAAAVREWRVAVTLPAGREPVAANRYAVFRVAAGTDVVRLVADAAARWNDLVAASAGRTQLVVSEEPLGEAFGGRLGREYVVDVAAAIRAGLGEGPTALSRDELVAILERYYGPGGVHRTVLVEAAPGLWVLSTLPRDRTFALLAAGDAAEAPPNVLGGAFRVDRWFAWNDRLDELDRGEALGWKPPPAMPHTPPIEFSASQTPERLVLRVRAQDAALRAALSRWLPGAERPARQ